MPEKNEEIFYLWPEHKQALDLFTRCQTQLKVSALGQVLGFSYCDVLAVAKLYEYNDLKIVFEDLQIMEIKAIEILNKQNNA